MMMEVAGSYETLVLLNTSTWIQISEKTNCLLQALFNLLLPSIHISGI
jgi:hypothetical protein